MARTTTTTTNRTFKVLAITLGLFTLAFTTSVFAADGKKVFDSSCKLCHGAGIAGAPKIGDKDAWAPRIAKGVATLEDHAINGFKDKGNMPARGGKSSLTDEEVKAAVAYIVEASQ